MSHSIKARRGVLGLLALLAAAFLFSSAPYAYANHEDGHVGPDEAPDVPFNAGDIADATEGSSVFIVGFESGVTIDDRAYTVGVTDQHPTALPKPKTENSIGSLLGPFTVSVAYSITGLPAGLYLDDSRVIRGTPTAATTAPAQVTYSATGTIIGSNGQKGGSHTRFPELPGDRQSSGLIQLGDRGVLPEGHHHLRPAAAEVVGCGHRRQGRLPGGLRRHGDPHLHPVRDQHGQGPSPRRRAASPSTRPRASWAACRRRWTSGTSPTKQRTRTAAVTPSPPPY